MQAILGPFFIQFTSSSKQSLKSIFKCWQLIAEGSQITDSRSTQCFLFSARWDNMPLALSHNRVSSTEKTESLNPLDIFPEESLWVMSEEGFWIFDGQIYK